ncbi:tryptophan--tRNA ligase [Candidatus Micrarchaeota archaeon]|nr:tryptophan--tRNA ligase [Candidatus Micrarchaeota archaeon]
MSMDEFKVTPWEVTGEIDYKKLTERFGTTRIDQRLMEKLKKACKGELHPMLRRQFFFSHRDLNLVLGDYEKEKGFFLYTGRKPSRGMHIGHLVPLLFTKWLQDRFKVNLYIEITDDEGFLHKKERTWGGVQSAAHDNILDIIAVGFDPQRTFIFKDSEYIRNVYPLLMKAARKVTNSTVKAVFGFTDSTNIGLSLYPAYQTVPTFFEKKRCLIPCAIDQDPYWRIQRDIAESLGHRKTAAIHCKFIPPLQGVRGKMSSSGRSESAIFLTDDEKAVKKKINKYAFSGGQATVEEHRKLGGNPDIDVPYQWLKILFEPDDEKLQQIHDEYSSGKMLTGELKSILVEKVDGFLAEHRKEKDNAEKSIQKFMYKGRLAKQMWEHIHE